MKKIDLCLISLHMSEICVPKCHINKHFKMNTNTDFDREECEDEPALLGVVLDQRVEGRVDAGCHSGTVAGELLLPGGRPLAHRVISRRRRPSGHARRPVGGREDRERL